jgi:type II secretory ATPase GspE/PulE/Tfp pilus assembly ATPase PilB-like protein
MVMTGPLKQAIMAGASSMELKKIAIAQGMQTLRQNALKKMLRGETDAMEVFKNTAPDGDNQQKTA